MDEKHDYAAALAHHCEMVDEMPKPVQTARQDHDAAILSALRYMSTRQSRLQAEADALEKGEAIKVRQGFVFLSTGGVIDGAYAGYNDDSTVDFTLTAVVPLPKPIEIEAKAEVSDGH